MDPLSSLVLTIFSASVVLYALYFVVRAGVRDGIIQADRKRAQAGQQPATRDL
ncbi:hypothetical protein [Paenarthrobacter sp. NCHU4564]|uniref:hypothetical protein n=1 Tax=Paenarthrobacter sp. NCHU4564 TaxID=3451353 RepID=UPI003F9E765D